MSGRRVLQVLLALMLGVGIVSVLPAAPPASADGASTDSAMTKSGDPSGPFANLKVTVSQTKNLINQVVTISWSGGQPTMPDNGGFSTNFLQIMQCWGDDPGPDRTQCQFGGGVAGSLQAGAWTRSRQLTYPFVDQKEKLTLPANSPVGSVAYVPFWPVGGVKPDGAVTSGHSDYFDSQVTNEIPLARTHGDGSGQEFFEVQTVRQAAGLGCGDPISTNGATIGRKCWLVVVPRGSTEVDGSTRSGGPGAGGFLESSPLSESNWENRIVFPLEFLPVGQVCPIGSPERRVIGHELAVEAVSHWQPALCTGGGALYSYTQLTDDVARSQVLDGSSPGLALVTNPIPPDQAPSDHPLVYAPVGLSGLAIAFNIQHQPSPIAPPEELKFAGQRFTSMKLTPRLVAKLLTQSYQHAVAGYPTSTPDYLKNKPLGLTLDPEFLKLNPDYTDFASIESPPGALVQLGSADVTSLLWSWVNADPDARAFIAGKPDEYGMVVNPANKNLTLPTSSFPVNDQSCANINVVTTVLKTCTLDIHPFATDMHDAGLAASRGDSKAQLPQLAPDNTPVLKKVDRQAPGQQALIAIVDTATAARYGLPTASLLNASGNYVAPSTESLQAGAKDMKPSAVPGVLASDPAAKDAAAYPLTALSYAVTSASTLNAQSGKDYAAFLRYAAGPGQQPGIEPGQLPLGMAPLPAALRTQTTAAAATIEAQAGKVPTQPPSSAGTVPSDTTSTAGSSSGSSPAGATSGSGTDAGSGASGSVTPPTTEQSGGPAANPPSLTQQVAGVLRRTPALPTPGWVGGLLVAVLVCGGLGATSSPVLQSPALRKFGAAVLQRVRRGIPPTLR